jgi:hypothetical protein
MTRAITESGLTWAWSVPRAGRHTSGRTLTATGTTTCCRWISAPRPAVHPMAGNEILRRELDAAMKILEPAADAQRREPGAQPSVTRP